MGCFRIPLRGICAAGSLVLAAALAGAQSPPSGEPENPPAEASTSHEAEFLSGTRQLTFAGLRSGEGYFSSDGHKLVFQSERTPENPFYQIYLMDLETGDTERISPGRGLTTCAWIHPDGDRILFASTHDDPEAEAKQQEKLEQRAAGKDSRYAWNYDDKYDIYAYDLKSKQYQNLTNAPGYDAEGSYSPDGQWIAFASNRRGYTDRLAEEQQAAFELASEVMMDIYIMRSDGSEVRQLTDTFGYDGGPFFSPDGKRICWRRFQPNGLIAEIMTMNVDGSDQRQLTRLGAMSWAPFYHPSGKYLIFTTTLHGMGNHELYVVDTEGKSPPVRVTYTDGFDGLAAFSPDGKQLAWTSNRTSSKQSQVFLADWNHAMALQSLGLSESTDVVPDEARNAAALAAAETAADFRPEDVLRHVDFLCRPQLEGRLTGSAGEKAATAYVAAYFDSLGLEPGGTDGSWYHEFEFTSGVSLGAGNRLVWNASEAQIDEQWRPLAFSSTGEIPASEVVFAGYGIVAPAEDGHDEYDSYVHLDVQDKWVIVLRYMPEDISPEYRQHLSRFTSLRFKTMVARDKGARGLVVVSGPRSNVKNQLVPLRFDGSLSGSSIPVISVTDDLVDQWLRGSDKQLASLQDKLDTGEPAMGLTIPELQIKAQIHVESITQRGRSVLGVLRAGERPTPQQVIVGAHVDHLGKGLSASSLAREDEVGQPHVGADDNASGVAALLEIAQYLAHLRVEGKWDAKRDVVFAAWSGEELGLLGSSNYIKYRIEQLQGETPHHEQPVASSSETVGAGEHGDNQQTDHGSAPEATGLHAHIAACLNLDMVGRLRDKLILQGVGSSTVWRSEVEQRNVPVGLPLTLQNDSYIPTDASAFFMRGVPILSAFTGSHSEYHTPRDTPDRLNYDGAAKTAKLMALITRSVARAENAPDYVPQERSEEPRRARMRAYLGTVPDYAESDVQGVVLSGVQANGPAQQAGVRGGDVIVELAGKKIENIYDYTYAIEALKIGEEVTLVVKRGDDRVTLKVTPGSRE